MKKEQDNKMHCVSCGRVICGYLDGVVNLSCPKCGCSSMVASFKDDEGTPRYIIWQTDGNNERTICRYIQDFIKKAEA